MNTPMQFIVLSLTLFLFGTPFWISMLISAGLIGAMTLFRTTSS